MNEVCSGVFMMCFQHNVGWVIKGPFSFDTKPGIHMAILGNNHAGLSLGSD